MKKAIRRHQQQVAKARHMRILRMRWGWPWTFIIWVDGIPQEHCYHRRNYWKQLGRQVMNEPGYWVHEFMIKPMRIRANRQLKLIEKGRDPDEFQWPDGKKPHIYYW